MKKIFSLAIAFLAVSQVGFAQLQGSTDAQLKQVAEAGKKVNTIECGFKRIQKQAFVDGETVEAGSFSYKQPDLMAMNYDNGEVFVIGKTNVKVGAGKKVRVMKKNNKHVEDMTNVLLYCVGGNLKALNGKLEKCEKKGKQMIYEIAVDFKIGRSKVSKIEVVYTAADGNFESIKMIESDGSYTDYVLNASKQYNKGLDDRLFDVEKSAK